MNLIMKPSILMFDHSYGFTDQMDLRNYHKSIHMESFLQEDGQGGQFYWALSDLKFSPTSGGLSQIGGLKFFTLWGGGGGGGTEDRICLTVNL